MCLFYLDDIIVFAATWEEHLARLRQVFERLRHAKLKLGAEKFTFAAREVSYLGHRVTEEGLLPDPSLPAGIREIDPPKNATEVRSFLGLASYYCRYVKNFTAIAGPLHALTRKDAVFHWSSECQDAFDRLKTLLTTSPITAFPDFSLPLRLYTDASTAGLGAILAQVREGKGRIICCTSRSFKAELGRLYKPARSSISKESTTRSRRDNFSGSNLSFTGLERSHQDYFSGSPSGQLKKNVSLTDPYREVRTAASKRSGLHRPLHALPCQMSTWI